jgi:plastocyanin
LTDANMHRRAFLALAGAATVSGLAGCTGRTASTDNQAEDTDPTSTSATEHADSEDDHAGEREHAETASGHADDGHGHESLSGDPVDHAEVSMTSTDSGEHFEAHVVRVTNGGTVRWTNESGSHSTTAYAPANDKPQLVPDGAASWDSGVLTAEGATFEHTFETDGVYHYYCTPHETLGMIGSVIVGEPDAHDQPALEAPPEDMSERVREKIVELNEVCNEALGHTH